MQFQCRNTLSFFAITVLLVCVLQTAPGAKADCTDSQLKEKAVEICKMFMFIPSCERIAERVLKEFNAICSSTNGDSQKSTTATPPTETTKA